jgi:hypothetical protein
VRSATLDETVALVDAKLESNRKKVQADAGLKPAQAQRTA